MNDAKYFWKSTYSFFASIMKIIQFCFIFTGGGGGPGARGGPWILYVQKRVTFIKDNYFFLRPKTSLPRGCGSEGDTSPAKKPKQTPADLKDPVLRGVWRRFGLRPPPLASPGVSSSCSTFSNGSNDPKNAKRGWEETKDPSPSGEDPGDLKTFSSECNGGIALSSSCQKNSDSLEKTCIKLDILDAQITQPHQNAQSAQQSLFSPIFLPIDKNLETKYLMHKYRLGRRRGKTPQEQTYLFLEHPCGWFGFLYHMSV